MTSLADLVVAEAVGRMLADVAPREPPVLSKLILRDDVPRGHVWRYYDTRGRMIGYANQLDIAGIPRRTATAGDPALLWGIPVVVEPCEVA